MQARLTRHCYIVFLCFFLHRLCLHALGPTVSRVSPIYEYGVFHFIDKVVKGFLVNRYCAQNTTIRVFYCFKIKSVIHYDTKKCL